VSQKGNRFEYELNLLIEAKSAGISIVQTPIQTVYENGNKGTHFRPLVDSVRVLFPLIKFCASSLTSGIIDFILWVILVNLTDNLLFGVVCARVLSSVYNYTVNRIIVFKSGSISGMRSAIKYFSLVIVIMLLNYFILALLTNILKVPGTLAKILTEIFLFSAGYTVQRLFIFARTHNKK